MYFFKFIFATCYMYDTVDEKQSQYAITISAKACYIFAISKLKNGTFYYKYQFLHVCHTQMIALL